MGSISTISVDCTQPISVARISELVRRVREGSSLVFEAGDTRITVSSVVGALVVHSGGGMSIAVSPKEENLVDVVVRALKESGIHVEGDSSHSD